MTDYAVLARRAHWLVLASYWLLLAVFTLTTLVWVSPTRFGGLAVWLIHVVPLLPFAPGLLRGRIRNQVWLCFVILVYFCGAVLNAFRSDANVFDAVEIALTVLLFCAGTAYIRWAARAQRAAAAIPEN